VRYTYAGINVIYEDECGIGMQEKTIIVNKTWQHFFIFVLALADFRQFSACVRKTGRSKRS